MSRGRGTSCGSSAPLLTYYSTPAQGLSHRVIFFVKAPEEYVIGALLSANTLAKLERALAVFELGVPTQYLWEKAIFRVGHILESMCSEICANNLEKVCPLLNETKIANYKGTAKGMEGESTGLLSTM